MRLNEEIVRIDGPAGTIEMIVENPGAPRGLALICHPHPLFGGTNTNKVIQTLARTFANLNYVALRPSFRGVGQSEGKHDDGRGETEDMLAVLADAKRRYGDLPVVLAGFSFGAYVQTRVAEALADAMDGGIEPGSIEADALVERHREAFSAYFSITRQMQVVLGRMFEVNPAFTAHYDGVRTGLASWLRRIIDASARAHGIDPDNATWQ